VKAALGCLNGLQLQKGSYPRVWGATMFVWICSLFQKLGYVAPALSLTT
jgi:hypothetical protein